MSQKSINFTRYKKLSGDSDAFFYSDKFKPFYEIEISQNFSTNGLEFENYTAGNTNDPDDYKLPDISEKILPEKLSRINPFNKSKSISIKTYQYDEKKYFIEKNKIEEKKIDHISEDAIKFLSVFNNMDYKVDKKTDTDISFNSAIFTENKLILNERMFGDNTSLPNMPFDIKEFDFNSNQKKDKKIEKEVQTKQSIINNTRIQNSINEFEYDVNNFSSSNYNDFSNVNNTTNIIQSVKNEFINTVNETVNKMEKKILEQTVSNTHIKNIETNIVNVIENKLDEKEKSIIEKIDEKQKKDLDKFKHNFLNS